MANDEKTNETSLAYHPSQQLSTRASLVKRGLHDISADQNPAALQPSAKAIGWENATIRGACYRARKHYGPRELPGTRRFYFVCRIENATDYRQAPSDLQIFLRSSKNGALSAAPDANLVMLYRNENRYRSIDLGPRDWTLARLDFERTFPISRPTNDCQEDLLGDVLEIVARDSDGKITVVLRVS